MKTSKYLKYIILIYLLFWKMGNNFFQNVLGVSAGTALVIVSGILAVVLLIILGFIIYKYRRKDEDDDKTSFDEDRSLITKNTGKIQSYI